jgi:hypothetical protein
MKPLPDSMETVVRGSLAPCPSWTCCGTTPTTNHNSPPRSASVSTGTLLRRRSNISLFKNSPTIHTLLLDTGEEEEDDDPSSTSGSSPPSDLNDGTLTGVATTPLFTLYTAAGKPSARAPGQATTTARSEEEQRIISSWERIAGDIAKVPSLAELDVSGSAPEWRRLGVGEAERVGASIEAMIFEDVRAEIVRHMLEFQL